MKIYICMYMGTVCCVFADKSNAHTWLVQQSIDDGVDPNEVNGRSFEDLNHECSVGCDYYVDEKTILAPETYYEPVVSEPETNRAYQVHIL